MKITDETGVPPYTTTTSTRTTHTNTESKTTTTTTTFRIRCEGQLMPGEVRDANAPLRADVGILHVDRIPDEVIQQELVPEGHVLRGVVVEGVRGVLGYQVHHLQEVGR